MLVLTVNFTGTPGDENDRLIMKLANEHGADFLGSGTFLPDARDVEYEVTPEIGDKLKTALIAAGFENVAIYEEELELEEDD